MSAPFGWLVLLAPLCAFSEGLTLSLPFPSRFAAGPPRGALGAFRFLLENPRPNLTTCHAGITGMLARVADEHGFAFLDTGHFRPLTEIVAPFEAAGFRITRTEWFPRDTLLDGPDGMLNFLRMFRRGCVVGISEAEQETLFAETVARLRATHLRTDGWHADYTRQRLLCVRM